jgi:uncharacterized protein Usg
MADAREIPALPTLSPFRRFWHSVLDDYCRAIEHRHMPLAKSYSQAAVRGAAARAAKGS